MVSIEELSDQETLNDFFCLYGGLASSKQVGELVNSNIKVHSIFIQLLSKQNLLRSINL